MKLLNRFTGKVIFEDESSTIMATVGAAVKIETDLSGADLIWADLRGADLRGADLSWADLSGADLDFSSGLNFSCKTFSIKAGIRLAAQLAYHFCRIDFGGCDDAKKAQVALVNLANQFHRVDECGKIQVTE